MRKLAFILSGILLMLALSIPSAFSAEAGNASENSAQSAEVGEWDAVEENRKVNSVVDAYWDLAHQGEWQGYNIGPIEPQIELFPGPFKHHIQGMARSPRTNIAPVFYVSVSGDPFHPDSFPALMVVQMPSLAKHGERLGSNRLKREPDGGGGLGETVHTHPPAVDAIANIIKYDEDNHPFKHPSGIAMVGDILAVPMGGKRSTDNEELSEIKIIFYDCSDPLNPVEMPEDELITKPDGYENSLFTLPDTVEHLFADEKPSPSLSAHFSWKGYELSDNAYIIQMPGDIWYIWDIDSQYSIYKESDTLWVYDAQKKPPWSHGGQGVAITKLPPDAGSANGRFMLMTNDSNGAHFHWSNSGSFNDENFGFTHYARLDRYGPIINELHENGYWPDNQRFQNLTFVQEEGDDGDLYLLVARNTEATTPLWKTEWGDLSLGEDELFLFKILSPQLDCIEGDCPSGYCCNPSGLSMQIVEDLDEDNINPRVFVSRSAGKPDINEGHSYSFFEYGCNSDGCDDVQKHVAMRYQGNFLAGATAYVTPSGEMLYYAASHWADGDPPGNVNSDGEYDFVKLSEFSPKWMTAANTAQCAKPKFTVPNLGLLDNFPAGSAPLQLDAEHYMIEPWVRMYQNKEKDGITVTMDWRNQWSSNDASSLPKDDYDRFSDLDGWPGECRHFSNDYDGFSNCLSSFAWCGPPNTFLAFYDNEHYEEGDIENIYIEGSGKTVSHTFDDDGFDPKFNHQAGSARIFWCKDDQFGKNDDGEDACLGEEWYPWDLEDSYKWTINGDPNDRLVQDSQYPWLATYTPGPANTGERIKLEYMEKIVFSKWVTVGNERSKIEALSTSPVKVYAGAEFALEGSWSDADTDEVTLSMYWGDGTFLSEDVIYDHLDSDGYGGYFSKNHVYADDGTYFAIVMIYDGLTTASRLLQIKVESAPIEVEAGENQTAVEGEYIELDPATFVASKFDCPTCVPPTDENFSATIKWGDGTSEPPADITLLETPGGQGVKTTGTIQAGHHYADNGQYTVDVCVQDDDSVQACDSFVVTVTNSAPKVDVGADQDALEGALVTLAPVTFSDPGFDCPSCAPTSEENFTATVDWGDGTSEIAAGIVLIESAGSEGVTTTGTVQASHHYADDGGYTVEICVEDDDLDKNCDDFQVTVKNVKPTLHAGDDLLIFEGDVFNLPPATFTDPGFDCPGCQPPTEEDFNSTVDWGDGIQEPEANITLVKLPGSEGVLTTGTVEASHQYLAAPGVYTVTVCVTDDDGAETCDSLDVTVLHGFIRFCAYANEKEIKIEEDAYLDCSTGGMDKIELKKSSTVAGDVIGEGDVKLEENSFVGGKVLAGEKVEIKKNAVIAGGYTEYADILYITQVEVDIEVRGRNKTAKKFRFLALPPGDYGKITVKKGAIIQFEDGVYNIESLKVEKNATVKFDISDGSETIINVEKNINIHEDVKMIAVSGSAADILFKVSGNGVVLGKEAVLLGTIIAPEAHVDMHEDAQLTGLLYAEKVQVKKGGHVTYAPALNPFIEEFLP